MKYVEVNSSDVFDPSKMTITQKLVLQKIKHLNKKVQNALQKNYLEKLKYN